MAVGNVSRKKSRASISRSPVLAAAHDRGVDREQEGRPVAGRVGMGDAAADGAPVADLRVADGRGQVDDARVVVLDRGRVVDLAMGRPSPDDQVVVGLADAVEPGDVLQVDEQGRLGEPQLDERQQAVAAGQQLRLAFAVRAGSATRRPGSLAGRSRTDLGSSRCLPPPRWRRGWSAHPVPDGHRVHGDDGTPAREGPPLTLRSPVSDGCVAVEYRGRSSARQRARDTRVAWR